MILDYLEYLEVVELGCQKFLDVQEIEKDFLFQEFDYEICQVFQ